MRARWMWLSLIPALWFGAAAGDDNWVGAGVCLGVWLGCLIFGFVEQRFFLKDDR